MVELLPFAAILAKIIAFAFPASIVLLIIGIIADLLKRKFFWAKYALIFFVVVTILLVLLIAYIYNLTAEFK